MSNEQDKKTLPPYVPYTTFISFINGLREVGAIPSHIDKSIMHKMSGSGQSAMMATIKSMQLINENSVPNEILINLVNKFDEDYSNILAEIVPKTYPFLFNGSINIQIATSKLVEDKFREAGASGSTLTKCISFFLAIAKDANIPVSSHVRAPKLQRKIISKKKNGVAKPGKVDSTQDEPEKLIKEDDMEKITIPLPGMDDGYVFFPADMSNEQSKLAVKMTRFILDNFYGIEES